MEKIFTLVPKQLVIPKVYKHLVSNNKSTTYEQMRQYSGQYIQAGFFWLNPKMHYHFLFQLIITFIFSGQKKITFSSSASAWDYNCNFFQARHHWDEKQERGKTISENLTELACGSYILVFEKGSRALQLSMFSFLPNDYDHDYCSFYRRESSNNTD